MTNEQVDLSLRFRLATRSGPMPPADRVAAAVAEYFRHSNTDVYGDIDSLDVDGVLVDVLDVTVDGLPDSPQEEATPPMSLAWRSDGQEYRLGRA